MKKIALTPILVHQSNQQFQKMKKRKLEINLTDIFGINRVRFQANKDLDAMSTRSLSHFRGIHKQFEVKLTDTICRLLAPGQEKKMKDLLTLKSKTESDDSILVHLKNAFESCSTRKARLTILMLVPKPYAKPEICKIFQCSHYEIMKARNILKKYGTCAQKELKRQRAYSRLSFAKAQHFVDFLFSTGLLQEVAYGTVKLKFDNSITVANTN